MAAAVPRRQRNEVEILSATISDSRHVYTCNVCVFNETGCGGWERLVARKKMRCTRVSVHVCTPWRRVCITDEAG